jgi:hypothetical protein
MRESCYRQVSGRNSEEKMAKKSEVAVSLAKQQILNCFEY